MTTLFKGWAAGFAATLVLSALMMMKAALGLMPQLDIIAMLTRMMGASSDIVGWLAHFMIGTFVRGAAFVVLNRALPGRGQWLKGIWFGVGAWLLMMIAIMPMAGAGFFGTNFGIMAPMMTLILHIIFGAVLGEVFALERPYPTGPTGETLSAHR